MTKSRIRIVTDTSARFPTPRLWKHPLVTAAEFSIRQGNHQEVEDPLQPLVAYRSVFQPDEGPTLAAAPSPTTFAQIYRRLHKETDQIVSIHTAAAASQITHNALAASEEFLGRCRIQVIDSGSMSFGLGLLVQAAVHAAEAGQSFDDVVRVVRGMIPRLYMIFFVDDLQHLERHGLIAHSQAVLGNMLGVIAFLTMEDGRLIPMEKVRTRTRALEKLVEFVAEFSDLDSIAVLHGMQQADDDMRWLDERLEALHPGVSVAHADYGPTMATLVGANSLGVFVLERDNGA